MDEKNIDSHDELKLVLDVKKFKLWDWWRLQLALCYIIRDHLNSENLKQGIHDR